MWKRAIQSNLPYVLPIDNDADAELTSEQPTVTTYQGDFQIDPEEEISEEVMLEDEAKIIPEYNFISSTHFVSKPSTSKSAYDFGSSSSTTPDGGSKSKIKDHNFLFC